MQQIYAPWRAKYFENEEKGCPFCAISLNPSDDEANFVFFRDELCFCVMNRYPYTPAHFLIIPHEHQASPTQIGTQEWLHLQTLSQKGVALLEEYGAQGVNMGLNIHKSAGAGIPEHLHIHLIPRYSGDTNFFTTISECRTFGVDFKATFQKIKSLSHKHFG